MFGRLDRYVDGQQHLRQLGLAIPPELERFTVIVNWPRVVAESRVDRLDLKGFRVGDNLKLADDAWEFWRSSGLDEDQTSYLDFEVFGRSFKTVENDETGLHIENVSPIDILAHRDPVTGRLDAALRRYRDVDDYDFMSTVGWRLYLPDRTYTIDTNYQVRSVVENPLGIVPVVPAYRNPRTTIPLHKTAAPTRYQCAHRCHRPDRCVRARSDECAGGSGDSCRPSAWCAWRDQGRLRGR